MSRLLRRSLTLLFSLAAVPGVYAACTAADAEALAWLDKMSRSVQQVNYHGVVTLQRGADMQVMQVSHAVHGDSSSERLTQLTGQGAQVERRAHPLECIHPGHKLLRLGSDLQSGHCGIAENYRFSISDGERVAGRKSVRIRIEPRDMYRFGYVMALDSETGLLLMTETLGRGDRTLEKFQFANLSYTDPGAGTADVNLVHKAEHPHPQAGPVAQAVAASDVWGVRWLPRGFMPTDSEGGSAGRRTYTDGLSVFSVFLEQLDREIRQGEGLARSGGTTSYTRGMTLGGRPLLVTVIGEVPVNTARMVADSVYWTP
tara:strand:- start:158235 stop:159179 length:945 start_codon:yes stop_codon:yes gene_type:complete